VLFQTTYQQLPLDWSDADTRAGRVMGQVNSLVAQAATQLDTRLFGATPSSDSTAVSAGLDAMRAGMCVFIALNGKYKPLLNETAQQHLASQLQTILRTPIPSKVFKLRRRWRLSIAS
jgi:hypothetical protein